MISGKVRPVGRREVRAEVRPEGTGQTLSLQESTSLFGLVIGWVLDGLPGYPHGRWRKASWAEDMGSLHFVHIITAETYRRLLAAGTRFPEGSYNLAY